MPKAKLTDEEKENNFNTWKQTPEFESLMKLQDLRNKEKMPFIELATTDISFDMQPFLS